MIENLNPNGFYFGIGLIVGAILFFIAYLVEKYRKK